MLMLKAIGITRLPDTMHLCCNWLQLFPITLNFIQDWFMMAVVSRRSWIQYRCGFSLVLLSNASQAQLQEDHVIYSFHTCRVLYWLAYSGSWSDRNQKATAALVQEVYKVDIATRQTSALSQKQGWFSRLNLECGVSIVNKPLGLCSMHIQTRQEGYFNDG